MLFKLFEIVWDTQLTHNLCGLPREAIVNAPVDNDPTDLKLKLMDQLDSEYNGVVQDFKYKEI